MVPYPPGEPGAGLGGLVELDGPRISTYEQQRRDARAAEAEAAAAATRAQAAGAAEAGRVAAVPGESRGP
eukprot:4327238-Pyramimonas_sp.AAC.1